MADIELRFNVPFNAPDLTVMAGALTVLDRLVLQSLKKHGRSIPPLYKCGIRYHHPIGPERWWTIPEVVRHGYADCKSLAAWRAAELREQGVFATPVAVKKREDLVHVVVKMPDGSVEDPSRILGMGREKHAAGTVVWC
jgi:hypothetical protein